MSTGRFILIPPTDCCRFTGTPTPRRMVWGFWHVRDSRTACLAISLRSDCYGSRMTSPEGFTRQLLIRLRPATFAALQAEAVRDARPLNRMIDQLVLEALDARVRKTNRHIRQVSGKTVADLIAEQEKNSDDS